MAIPGVVSSSSREVPYAPASVSGVDYGTARAYNNARVDVSFTAPVHDGGFPITGYTASGYCTTHQVTHTATGAGSPLTITGFGSSISPVITVTATNAIGTGPTISSSPVFTTTIPQAVTIGTATATGAAGTATVGFTANGTGGKTVTYTATSSPDGIVASSSGSPITVTGLTNGTAYTFTVVASNANGSAAASAASNAATPYTTPAPPAGVSPGVPRFLYATANTSSTGGTYGFSAPATGTFPITVYYEFILQYSGPVVYSNFTFNNSSESANFSYSNNGNYKLTAYSLNSYGTSATVETSGYTPFQYTPCITPGSMAGLINASYNTSTQTITWSWSAPNPSSAGTWYIYSINGGPYSMQTGTSVTSSSGYNTTNTIQVYASQFCNPTWNDGGIGTTSITTQANPIISPGSMAGLISGSWNNGLITFNWSPPTGTAPFTYYYSTGYGYTSTGSTSYSQYADSLTLYVYAYNSAGAGTTGSYSVTMPSGGGGGGGMEIN